MKTTETIILSALAAASALVLSFIAVSCSKPAPEAEKTPEKFVRSYDYDGQMPENVLRSYLSRSLVVVDFLLDDAYLLPEQKECRELDETMVVNTGAKLISRTLQMWGNETRINDPEFLGNAKKKIALWQERDPEMAFHGSIFECVSPKVSEIAIPACVFEAFGRKPEQRNFIYEDMLYQDGFGVGTWKKNGSIPDISRPETQLWYYFLATSYIDAGIEFLHFGNAKSVTHKDKESDYAGLRKVQELVRAYGKEHCRRHYVTIDGNVMDTVDGHLLFDFITLASRPLEDIGHPRHAIFKVGYRDAIYRKTPGGITPSGWSTPHSLYHVHIDNCGVSKTPGKATLNSHFVWGWDEITWFSQQPEDYRNEWLHYAWNWIKTVDGYGYLKMVGNGPINLGDGTWGKWYRANTRTAAFPAGASQEETIKEIWANDKDEFVRL